MRTGSKAYGMEESRDKELTRLFSSYRVPRGKTKELAWEAIFDKIENEERKVKQVNFRIILKVAATVAVLLVLATPIWLFVAGNVTVKVPRGQHAEVYLPDNSHVEINAESQLHYNKRTWLFARKVELSGEAKFKVTKGNRFDVKTSSAITSVLGTVFNVYSRNGNTTVTCVEGKVRVKAIKTNNQVIITKGMQAQTKGFNMKKVEEVSVKDQSIPWTKGEFYFDKASLSKVFEEIERQFNVDIFFEGDSTRKYTGYFNRTDLNAALSLVCIPMNLDWEKSNEVIIIYSK